MHTMKAIVWGVAIGAALVAAAVAMKPRRPTARAIRIELFNELQPVALTNCTLERVGSEHDGGYLMCGNLLGNIQSSYSYGIAGHDDWGCQMSRRLKVPLHQYDCFDTTEPACPGGQAVFHPECIGSRTETVESRPFDTLANQIARNGDAGKTLLVKMDVEGAELESLMTTAPEVIDRFDQLAIELHSADQAYLDLVRRLKQFFHVAHLHYNNSRCTTQYKPFPSPVYEVLFVNKRIAGLAPGAPKPMLPSPLDAQNDLFRPDCQTPVQAER